MPEKIIFESPQAQKSMYKLINVFANKQFRSFWLLIVPLLLVAKSWNLDKVLKLTNSFNFWILSAYTATTPIF